MATKAEEAQARVDHLRRRLESEDLAESERDRLEYHLELAENHLAVTQRGRTGTTQEDKRLDAWRKASEKVALLRKHVAEIPEEDRLSEYRRERAVAALSDAEMALRRAAQALGDDAPPEARQALETTQREPVQKLLTELKRALVAWNGTFEDNQKAEAVIAEMREQEYQRRFRGGSRSMAERDRAERAEERAAFTLARTRQRLRDQARWLVDTADRLDRAGEPVTLPPEVLALAR